MVTNSTYVKANASRTSEYLVEVQEEPVAYQSRLDTYRRWGVHCGKSVWEGMTDGAPGSWSTAYASPGLRGKRLFLDLVNAQGLVGGTTAVESFISGFRL